MDSNRATAITIILKNIHIKEVFVLIKNMGKERSIMSMEMCIMGNGSMAKNRE